jgi:hypothetical protein
MTHNAFEFMRQIIHFCNNRKRKAKGQSGYDSLFKITWIIDAILTGIQKVWIPGNHLAIGKSMVKSMGWGDQFYPVHEEQAHQAWDQGVCLLLHLLQSSLIIFCLLWER